MRPLCQLLMHLTKSLPNAKPRAVALGGGTGANCGATVSVYGGAARLHSRRASWPTHVHAHASLVCEGRRDQIA